LLPHFELIFRISRQAHELRVGVHHLLPQPSEIFLGFAHFIQSCFLFVITLRNQFFVSGLQVGIGLLGVPIFGREISGLSFQFSNLLLFL
jgi:hypothetical protein